MAKEFSKKSHKRIRLSAIVIFFISLAILLLSFKNIILVLGLFIFCLIFMFRWGQFIFLDLDPVPFSAIILLYIYDYKMAIHFLLLAQPSIDLVSSRLNHFSIVNLLSMMLTIFVFSLPWLKPVSLYFAIITFNVIRSILNHVFGFGFETLMFNMAHACVYFVLGSLIGFFI